MLSAYKKMVLQIAKNKIHLVSYHVSESTGSVWHPSPKRSPADRFKSDTADERARVLHPLDKRERIGRAYPIEGKSIRQMSRRDYYVPAHTTGEKLTTASCLDAQG